VIVNCAICDRRVRTLTHTFQEGVIGNPSKVWNIEAPMYFKASEDHRSAVENYCGPACATQAFLRANGR
jgi:hypothetical protein